MSYTPPCETCGGTCCRYVAIELDKPKTKREYDDLRWYLTHRDVSVFIDHSNKWHVEFRTPCEKQDKNGRCTIYEVRPKICREYGTVDGACEYYDSPYKEYFSTLEEFEKYMDGTGKNWRFK